MTASDDGIPVLRAGDVVEITLNDEPRTAEVMLVTDDGLALLDLFDGDRLAWARLSQLEGVAVYRPEADDLVAAA